MKDQEPIQGKNQEYSYSIRIPKDRIAVLIGKEGEVKDKIEQETQTKLDIDSKEGDVFITGKDALKLFTAKEIVRAVARGFNPEIASQLLNPDYTLEIIKIEDFVKTKNEMIRLKGRVIGSGGKSRKHIEELTQTKISVYGKTIAIIGEVETVNLAKRAVESLLKGSPHGNVYKWLQKQILKEPIF